MNKNISVVKNFILDLIFPIHCVGCGAELENLNPRDRWICKECIEKIKTKEKQVCPACEKPSDSGKTHFKCEKKTFLDGLWAAAEYNDSVINKAIHNFKFNFARDISFALSKVIIKSVFEVEEFSDFQDIIMSNFSRSEEEIYVESKKNRKTETLIIPVPLHRKRLNWRGFNQSALLSKHISKKFNLAMSENLLIRTKNTRPQSQIKSFEERKNNLRGAFFCKKGDLIKGKNVIIVDDVCTTLATLNECAAAVKKVGAKSVWGLVVARR